MWELTILEKIWPIRGEFRLSRGSRTEVNTLQMKLVRDGYVGNSEAVPYGRYGESPESVCAQIDQIRLQLADGFDHQKLLTLLKAGAARNLCDLALWDWESKSSGKPVWELAGLPKPTPLITAYTLSLDEPSRMADAARKASQYPLLKLKLGTSSDVERLVAIRSARPDAKLIVDANEGWTIEILENLTPVMSESGVVLCEQPLPANKDGALEGRSFPFSICADESVHTSADIAALKTRYQAVNIKLDKAGGLTEALRTADVARRAGLVTMVGCMLASSLALAPAVLLAGIAHWVDLDGPLLLAADHSPGLDYAGAQVLPPSRQLWG